MRRIIGLLPVVVLLVAGTPADAAVFKRTCAERAEGPGPTRFTRPGDVRVGPVSFIGAERLADPEAFEEFRNPRTARYVIKAPIAVRAGRVVSLALAPAQRRFAAVEYSYSGSSAAVRIFACPRDEPAFSYVGQVGEATVFPGALHVRDAMCLRLVVRQRGRARPYRRTLSLGMGDSC